MLSTRCWLAGCLSILMLIASACATRSAGRRGPGAAPVDFARLGAEVDVVTVHALLGRDDAIILDVREPSEYDAGHIPGVKLMPKDTLSQHLAEIPTDRPVIVTCRSGKRSGLAADYLRGQGYTNVHSMAGGIVAWEAAGYRVEK